eukprot:SAG11_NODE_16044_length_558_cov_1.235294_1_plen_160_part_10
MDPQALNGLLAEMRSMGFMDDSMSARALQRARYDVEGAVDLLFQGAISDSEEMDVAMDAEIPKPPKAKSVATKSTEAATGREVCWQERPQKQLPALLRNGCIPRSCRTCSNGTSRPNPSFFKKKLRSQRTGHEKFAVKQSHLPNVPEDVTFVVASSAAKL